MCRRFPLLICVVGVAVAAGYLTPALASGQAPTQRHGIVIGGVEFEMRESAGPAMPEPFFFNERGLPCFPVLPGEVNPLLASIECNMPAVDAIPGWHCFAIDYCSFFPVDNEYVPPEPIIFD